MSNDFFLPHPKSRPMFYTSEDTKWLTHWEIPAPVCPLLAG